ncbi:hypothetical protein DFH28DRAFT_1080917 [Melampsora americana]|nr:hypothetical protein DFH28DRAFT_1080917 [Melampsora americana]
MAKWQGHLKSQQAIIAKIQGNPTSEHTIGSLPKPSLSMNSTMNRIVSKSSAPPMSTNNNLGNYPTSLLGGPTSLSGTSLNASTSYSNRNSPRPLPVPDSFEDHDEEWRRRKNRRKTIEQDMAKLRDENVVERKRNVLMSSSPRNMTSKPKRNLSGLSSRVNRLNNLNQFETHEIIPPLPSSNKTLNERLKD